MSNRTTKGAKTVLILSVLFVLSVVVPPSLAASSNSEAEPVLDSEAGSLTKLAQAVLAFFATATGTFSPPPIIDDSTPQ